MAQTFRVFGGELGEPDGYIDCDVVGITPGNGVELADQDTKRTWRIDPDRIEQLGNDDLLYDYADVNTSKAVWKAISNLEKSMTDSSTADDKSHYTEAMRTLFQGA